jgi:hypothetical protein
LLMDTVYVAAAHPKPVGQLLVAHSATFIGLQNLTTPKASLASRSLSIFYSFGQRFH